MAITPPPFALVSGDILYDVVDGQIVEKPPIGADGAWLASALQGALGTFARDHRLGWVVREMLFVIDGKRNLMRRLDLAFVSFDRWPRDRRLPVEEGWDVVPDLAVEVVGRSHTATEVNLKIDEYFRAGVRQVWVIYPMPCQVYVHESTTSIRVLFQDDALDGEPLLPGFRLPLRSLFEAD